MPTDGSVTEVSTRAIFVPDCCNCSSEGVRAEVSTGEIIRPSGRVAASASMIGRWTDTSHWAEPSALKFTPSRAASCCAAQVMEM